MPTLALPGLRRPMSKANRKGYTTIVARDQTGALRHVPVKKGSKLHKMYIRKNKALAKEQKKQFREFKDNMRLAKKAFSPEDRAKVNWWDAQQRPPERAEA